MTNKEKAKNANKRAREQRESMTVGAVTGAFLARPSAAVVGAVLPEDLPPWADDAALLGAGVVELGTSFAFKKGGAGRVGLQVAAASHAGDALAGLLARVLFGAAE